MRGGEWEGRLKPITDIRKKDKKTGGERRGGREKKRESVGKVEVDFLIDLFFLITYFSYTDPVLLVLLLSFFFEVSVCF